MNMGIITKNIKKIKDNEAKSSFLDNFGCLPRGSLTMIYAGAYTGKSSFMTALARDIVKNKKEISYYHIDGDNTLDIAQDRGIDIIEDEFSNFHYEIVTDKPKKDRFEFLKQITQCDASELKNSLIVIDSVKDFFIGDMTKDKDVNHFMEILKVITAKGGTVVILHHQTKQIGEENNKAWKGSTTFNDSADNTYYVSSIKKERQMIISLEVIKKRANIANQSFVIYKETHKIKKLDKDEIAIEFLNDKERYTIEIAKEIIDERLKITQSELSSAVKQRADIAGVLIVGDNKKWKLFDKFNGKFWRIDNSKTATKKVFYPILSENFKIAQEKKEQYLQKLIEIKKSGKLPISLSKFGNFLWPHLNAKEVEKLLINDIMLDDKGQNIVDIITKD